MKNSNIKIIVVLCYTFCALGTTPVSAAELPNLKNQRAWSNSDKKTFDRTHCC